MLQKTHVQKGENNMKNNKGFSLVELIVVIAIMAILAAVAIPTFATFINKAQVSNEETLLNDLQYAVNLAKVEYDMTVTDAQGNKTNIEDGALSVTIANGKITKVTLGTTDIYTTSSDEYDLAQVVDMDYTFKQIDGTTTPKGDGHWNFN